MGLFFLEMIGGVASGSIALRSEALHVLSDAFSAIVSLSVVVLLRRSRSGNDNKIRGAGGIASALLLLGASAEIFREAVGHLVHPMHIITGVMFCFAVIGAVFNYYLHTHVMAHDHDAHSDEITNTSLDLHIVFDLYQSLLVIAASVVIFMTGWRSVDPILSIALAAWMAVRTLGLARQGFCVCKGQEQ
jgi:cobalt-zinc-cadmium efflux system protein